MADAAARIAEIKAKTEEKRKKLEALKNRNKAGGARAVASAVTRPAAGKAVASARPATATATASAARPVAAFAASPKKADAAGNVSALLSSMGEGASGQNLGKLEMYSIETSIVDVQPQEFEKYGRYAQTDLSMEDGNIFVGDTPAVSPEEGGGADDAKEPEREEEAAVDEPEPEPVVKVMDDDDFLQLVARDTRGFNGWFGESSKLMMKAIHQASNFNIFSTINEDTSVSGQRESLSLYKKFFDEDLCEERAVTDIHWSPRPNEPLMLATYSSKRGQSVTAQDPDGLALIWSFHLPDEPEQVFECQSAVMAGLFDAVTPHMVIGGTVSGQIVLWDRRVGETNKYPVIKTPLTAQTHTDPVYAISQVGGRNQEQKLISASTDGRVCVWDLKKMQEPTAFYKLQARTVGADDAHIPAKTSDLSVMAMDMSRGETDGFYGASDDCMLYYVNNKDKKEDKAGKSKEDVDWSTQPRSTFKDHAGPITGVNVHPGVMDGQDDDPNWRKIQERWGDLVLTSSTDWTVRLWNYNSKSSAEQRMGSTLKTFDDPKDYVYDVQWSPQHPALFSAVDGQGYLSIFDLTAADIELPVVKYKISDMAINRARWCPNHDENTYPKAYPGYKIATGDSSGQLLVYDLDTRVALPPTDSTEKEKMWKALRDTLSEMDDQRTSRVCEEEEEEEKRAKKTRK